MLSPKIIKKVKEKYLLTRKITSKNNGSDFLLRSRDLPVRFATEHKPDGNTGSNHNKNSQKISESFYYCRGAGIRTRSHLYPKQAC